MIKQVVDDLDIHLKAENNRPLDDYQFYKSPTTTNRNNEKFTLSPLASTPEQSTTPGLRSYFQVDEAGVFSCPLLPFSASVAPPEDMGSLSNILSKKEVQKRITLRKEIEPLLTKLGFIKKNVSNVSFPVAAASTNQKPSSSYQGKYDNVGFPAEIKKISTFQIRRGNEDNNIVFYRDIWDGNNKVVQGFIVNEQTFLLNSIVDAFANVNSKTEMLLRISYGKREIAAYLHKHHKNTHPEIHVLDKSTYDKNIPLSTFSLKAPFEKYQLSFSVDKLPLGDATKTGGIFLIVILCIIIAGLLFIYRLGVQQIYLNEERLNFVSSVSHELKTPLTSIIMYADMLRSGMLTQESKRNEYYNFIFFEGERLGRLIANVLRLSKFGRDTSDISLEYTPLSSAIDILRSKTSTLLENSGFTLRVKFSSAVPVNCSILIDKDAFTQIAINLVDNAVKFTDEFLSRNPDSAADPERRNIDLNIDVSPTNEQHMQIGVRDYGAGIAKEDAKHIFKSFYRAGNELTRKTKGTGMGLSLVNELVQTMDGEVEFFNRKPGAEFVISLPYRTEEK